MAGAASKGDKEVAGEKLGDGAEILGAGQVGVLHEHLVADQRLTAAVLGQRGPTGEERPYRALVVAHAVIELLVAGHVAQSPVGIERVRGKLAQAALGMSQDRLAAGQVGIPPGHGRVDSCGAVKRAVDAVIGWPVDLRVPLVAKSPRS